MTVLPEQAGFIDPLLLGPSVVILYEVSEQAGREGTIRMDGMHRPDRVGKPCGIVPGLRPRRAEPIARVVPRIPRIAKPANFIELVPRRTTDRAIRARPERAINEFREGVAAGR